MDKRTEKTIAALQKNNIDAIYCPKKDDIVPLVEKMLFEGCSITAGGSVSVKECGVWELINKDCYNFCDRSKSGITNAQKLEAFKSAIGCDFFFCSSNAVTENGELINVDGLCNRVSSIAFGPEKVIMIVGVNKLVKDINEGFLRVKTEAAPKNAVRLGINTPCAKLGHCISLENNPAPDFTDGCLNERRICSTYTVNAYQRDKGRITLIICGEPLGY